MKNYLENLGKKSKNAFSDQLTSKKKNQVLKEYYKLIQKNKKKIINQNKRDLNNAKKILKF